MPYRVNDYVICYYSPLIKSGVRDKKLKKNKTLEKPRTDRISRRLIEGRKRT